MNKNNIHYFVEFEEYPFSNLKSLLDERLFQKGLCVRNKDNVLFKFVGITFTKNIIIVVFPKGYQFSSNQLILRQHIRLLIDVFLRYEVEKKVHEEESKLLTGRYGSAKNIQSMKWIIEDYIENGIFIHKEHLYNINGSYRINWSKTIKTQNPVIINNSPFYLDLVTKKHSINLQNSITLIHQYVIQESLRQIGWLFEYEEVENMYEAPFDDEQSIYILDLAIQQTFSDREILLFNYLKSFILGSNNNSENSMYLFATQYFHWIWEHICLSVFSNNEEEVLSPPNPYWMVRGEKVLTSQIPDVMFRKGKTIYILDAKYYQVDKAPQKLPGWKDLVKQLFYRHTLLQQKSYSNHEIVNIFLFPKDHDDIISYLGYAGVEEQTDLGEIKAFLISITKAMELYVSKSNGSLQKNLIRKYIEL